MVKQITSILLLLQSFSLFAQDIMVQATIRDAETQKAIENAVIEYLGKTKLSDASGSVMLVIPQNLDQVQVSISHTSYKPQVTQLKVNSKLKTIVFQLEATTNRLEMVNVSASGYRKQINKEVLQVDIIRKDLIQNVNSTRLFDVVDKVPGVVVVDGQVNIRNGSGFAYGVGSRVMMVVDDMPILTADRGDIRWNFAPMEMIEEMEVVKGPSSVLYGSGALNGTIHVKTFWPTKKSETRVQTFYQHIGKPRRPELAWWWDGSPYEYGVSLAHGQKLGNVDLVFGYNELNQKSFIDTADQNQKRMSVKMRWTPTRSALKGFKFLISGSFMDSQEVDFLSWNDADSGAYRPLTQMNGNPPRPDPVGLVHLDRRQWYITPEIHYENKRMSHFLRARRYNLEFLNFRNNLQAQINNVHYTFQYRIGNHGIVRAGYEKVDLDVLDINNFGREPKIGNQQSGFLQLDLIDYKKFNATVGVRYESFNIDTLTPRQVPVFRAGVNYEIDKTLNLRANFGQGFRFPSVTELFIDKTAELIPLFPNLNLSPEYGYNVEVGIKKNFRLKNWNAYLDFSLFFLDYYDMIEIALGLFLPDSLPPNYNPLDYLGFNAQNVARSRNGGLELSFVSEGNIGKFPLRILTGYTYSLPVDLNSDTTNNNLITYWGRVFGSMVASRERFNEEYLSSMLKYRNRHLVKVDVESGYKNWMVGLDFRFYSRVEHLDSVFFLTLPGESESLLPGIGDYYSRRSGDEYIINVRLGYTFFEKTRLTFVVNNLLNREYGLRFNRLEAPRNYAIQLRFEL